jgi:hypothetical protein
MRPIFILAVFGTLLLLPGVSVAETDTECQITCANEKASRDENCPPLDADADQARAQCMRESQDTFNSCVYSCPQPEPADTPKEN